MALHFGGSPSSRGQSQIGVTNYGILRLAWSLPLYKQPKPLEKARDRGTKESSTEGQFAYLIFQLFQKI